MLITQVSPVPHSRVNKIIKYLIPIFHLPDNNTKNRPEHMNMHIGKHKNIRDAKEVTG